MTGVRLRVSAKDGFGKGSARLGRPRATRQDSLLEDLRKEPAVVRVRPTHCHLLERAPFLRTYLVAQPAAREFHRFSLAASGRR